MPPRPDPNRSGPCKIGAGHDQRKREIGDEAEQWALASIIGWFLAADPVERENAIDAVLVLLAHFEGTPVERACGHAARARERDIDDEEELIEALMGLLHLSRHSDAFGFDLIGWLEPAEGANRQAMCIEVKGSADGSFILSRGEWSRAQQFNAGGEGGANAVLVVRRDGDNGAPCRLDLLVDPVSLLEGKRLSSDVDGYRITYQSNPPT